jgi:hypothetical protein
MPDVKGRPSSLTCIENIETIPSYGPSRHELSDFRQLSALVLLPYRWRDPWQSRSGSPPAIAGAAVGQGPPRTPSDTLGIGCHRWLSQDRRRQARWLAKCSATDQRTGSRTASGAMRPWASWPRPGNLDTTEVTLVVDRGVINALVARKYLRPTDRSTKDAMRYAIQDCLERALGLSDKVGSF